MVYSSPVPWQGHQCRPCLLLGSFEIWSLKQSRMMMKCAIKPCNAAWCQQHLVSLQHGVSLQHWVCLQHRVSLQHGVSLQHWVCLQTESVCSMESVCSIECVCSTESDCSTVFAAWSQFQFAAQFQYAALSLNTADKKRNAYSKTYQFFWKTACVITISFTLF